METCRTNVSVDLFVRRRWLKLFDIQSIGTPVAGLVEPLWQGLCPTQPQGPPSPPPPSGRDARSLVPRCSRPRRLLARRTRAGGGVAWRAARGAAAAVRMESVFAVRGRGGERVTLRLSLKQQGVARLQEAAERVSDPFSTSYGQHLTREQVEALVAPLPSDVAAVEGWLRGEGLLFSRPAVEVFEVALAARDAERLLRTRLGAFANSATGQRAVRAEDFMLPPEVDAAVAAVYGLHGLPLPPREAAAPPGPPAQAANVTPEVLATRYGISGVTPSGSVGNRQAVAEFQGQLIAQRDLDKFFADYVPSAAARSSKIYRYVGNKGTGPSGVESALDVDYIMGVAPGVLTEYWYWGGMDFCADLKNWTGTILASDSPPLVHSVSYGWQGNLSQVGCKPANVQDVDVNLMKLAARGITIQRRLGLWLHPQM
ncbi:unnamed protein product [Prorocentrum cordatum]|uniref:subtilisin n=1 Tax=Prorocentrum cordatum TaxID=2364126 RepID=A0ABN9WQI1_9DINO|nr:unnamed protein product [Polarella glacialis]